MPAVDLRRKAHVYPLNFLGQHEGTGSESYGEQFRLQLSHPLR